MNSRKHFEGGYMYPQDQELKLGSSWLPGNETGTGAGNPGEQLRSGSQTVLFDRFDNPLAGADWQLVDFSNQLIQGLPNYNSDHQSHNPVPHLLAGADWQLADYSNQLIQRVPNYNSGHHSHNPVPHLLAGADWQHADYSNQLIQGASNYNSAYQSHNPVPQVGRIEHGPAIRIGNTLNPYCQPNHTNYAQAISNGSTSRSANLMPNPSAGITATRDYQNMNLSTDAGVPSNAMVPDRLSMPSIQSFVDNWGQPVSVSSLLDILTQPLSSTIFSNDKFHQWQQSTRMEMRFIPADDEHEHHSNVSTGALQVLNQHDCSLNQQTGMDDHTRNASLVAKTPVTPNKTRKPKKFQLTMRTENTNEQNYLKSKENEAIQHTCHVMQNVVDSSTAASTLPREAIDLEKVGDHGIDLNKTPEQKLPKRRKHRPKVVIEGTPKRTTGATTKKSASSKEKSSGKRKYVRRKGLTEPDQETDTRKKPADSKDGRVRRSCKRTLDLDLDLDLDKSKDENPENIVHQPEMQQSNRYFDLNSISEDTGLCSRFDRIGKMESMTKINQQNGSEKVNEKESAHTYHAASISCSEHMWNENTYLHNRQIAASFPATDRVLRTGNLDFTYRHGETGNDDQQPDHEGTGQSEVITQGGLERNINIMSYTAPEEVMQSLIKPAEARRLGRRYNHAVEHTYYKTMCQEVLLQKAEGCRNSCSAGAASEYGQKKRKTENKVQMDSPARQSGLLVCADDKTHSGIKKGCCPTNESLHPQKPTGISFPGQHNASPPQTYTETVAEIKKLAQANSSIPQIEVVENQNFISLLQISTEVDKCKQCPATPAKTSRSVKKRNSKSMPKQSAKIKGANTTFTSNVSNANRALQEHESSSGYPRSLQKMRGEAEVHMSPYMDEVIKLFSSLDIRVTSDQDKKALIPYGGGGAIIPLDTKRKRPRPKVDLDNETIRVWNLLMRIEGSTDRDGMYKGSKSWWENEREVFRGRADSFIARMRLVQGDRHFSMWKGSVVDSVIGVFLTQNVSDHLSSSAFMSLAAQFPLKLRSGGTAGPQDSAGILVEEPETCVPDTGEPVSNEKASHILEETSGAESQSFQEEIISSQDSFDLSVNQGTEAIRSYSGSNSETEDPIPGSAYHKIHESTLTDVLSLWKATPLEDNYNCITNCSLSDQRSNHGHTNSVNFEHERHTTFIHTGNSGNLLKRSQDIHSENNKLHTTDNRVLQEGFGEESSSSWASTISGLSQAKHVACTSSRIEQTGSLNSCTVQNRGLSTSKENPPRSHKALSENNSVYQQSTSLPKYKTADSQQSCINSQTESTTGIRHINLTALMDRGSDTIQQFHNMIEGNSEVEESHLLAEKQRKLENIVDVSNSNDQFRPSATTSKGNNSTVKRKKGKAGGEIKPDEFWESLRKQVLANSTKKERSYDTMDSMDYEAIRHASVKYISGLIRERGMNNMLAERIKEFLNRLVRVHGSIDLEWLRDVPPDEAKNYLLNIWGIGLKSVECVRLLTLHHLAFPVDTNVGRIAVRLGWVPLQPLPESLQLHLLELYPILETVQKYLWPRLCNLDQQTLYELHYHLITFGKVFCTKHKPNCNACPMRGECRHFASAFASARLALPGPEQKSIVSSCPRIASEGNPSLVINTALQLPADNGSFTGTCSGKSKCEPIIEEPKTPELESTEVLEYDIEDTFWEDSDEIPMVRLNMQEFTANLQNYVQANNMELQESDVSKALVALTQEAASIPAPKLKNVNRLRTEHRVYELPDLHPLLGGMDRREPDDPSPYLLAIWTPGETANTVQPQESICSSRETGQLCNEETCFTCNTVRESESHTVRGTLLIPCRTAMRGRFPLNGTYFQVNEVFADDKSSKNPTDVPREWLWNLPIRTVYFGTSVTSIFRGLSTEQIQLNFWRGFVCVRGFDRETRAPRPLVARLHCSPTRLTQEKNAKAKEESLNNNGNPEKGSSKSSANKMK